MKTWHEDDAFWETMAPMMFTKGRLRGTPEEIDNTVEMLGVDVGAHILDLACGAPRGAD